MGNLERFASAQGVVLLHGDVSRPGQVKALAVAMVQSMLQPHREGEPTVTPGEPTEVERFLQAIGSPPSVRGAFRRHGVTLLAALRKLSAEQVQHRCGCEAPAFPLSSRKR